jgi:C4-dicarboxylate transporter DctM subunit
MVAGLLLIIVACFLLAEPLFVLMGGVSAWLLWNTEEVTEFGQLISIVEETRELSDKVELLAIPFFVISGALMSEGDIARRLVAVARAIFAPVPGGLAVAAVSACVFFAAISGSSPVTVIAIGSIMYPTMVAEKYNSQFSAGLLTSAGSLGILIPPSIPMIVYAICDPNGLDDPPRYAIAADPLQGLDISHLFLAGVGPGLLIGAILAGFAIFTGWRAKMPTSPFVIRDVVVAVRNGFWSLMLPVLILGGIYGGLFTPTESAAVSVIYALIVELGIHRSLKLRDIPRILGESTVLIGSLLVIMALAQGFNKYLADEGVALRAAEWITSYELSPVGFLLVVNILLLIVGCFMDILSAIFILVPLLSPMAYQLGIHPLHLAVIFIVNLEIGYLTPPFGLNLFVATTIFQKSLGDIIKSVVPFIALMLVALGLITYFPVVSLGPVSAFNGHSFWVPFPERRLPLDPLEFDVSTRRSIEYLANLAEREDERANAEAAEQPAAAPTPEPGRVLTMEEMMAQSQAQLEAEDMAALDGDEPAEPTEAPEPTPEPGRVLTMEEMMAQSQAQLEAEDMAALEADEEPEPEPTPAAPPEPGRVLTMEEMMAQSQAQLEAEDMDALEDEPAAGDAGARRLEDLLHDFRDLFNDRAVTLAELAARRRERAAEREGADDATP